MEIDTLNGHKRAVIYARVSTDEQATKGYSLPTQIEACERYAHDNGLEVVGVFKDDYTGTSPIESRPEGRKAYEMLSSNQADVFIAYRIDRIVRPPEDGDEWDMPILIRGLAKLNKAIHTLDRGQLKTDFASLLIAMLDAKGAGDERRKIIERTTRGRNRKVQEGKVLGTGKPPYGYTFSKDSLVINEAEAAIVRMIYQWYVYGENDEPPMTDYTITRKLSAMGIPTPGESRARHARIRGSSMWCYATTRHILITETYAGVLRFGRNGTFHKGEKRVKRPKNALAVLNVFPIVSPELWDAAQARRERNKQMSARNSKHEYLLRSLITCGCGCKMTGRFCGESRRYRCHSDSSFIKGIEHDRFNCHEKTANADVLEAVVWQYVLDILTDPIRFEAEWRKAQAIEQDALAPKRDRLETIRDLIKHCEQEANETAAALKRAKGIVLAKLEADMDSVNNRYIKLTDERDRLLVELQTGARLDEGALSRALQFRADVIEGLKHPTFDDKRLYLDLLRVTVKVKDGKAVIGCALPIEPIEVDLSAGKLTLVLQRGARGKAHRTKNEKMQGARCK